MAYEALTKLVATEAGALARMDGPAARGYLRALEDSYFGLFLLVAEAAHRAQVCQRVQLQNQSWGCPHGQPGCAELLDAALGMLDRAEEEAAESKLGSFSTYIKAARAAAQA